jgi:hypothetical protein
MIEQPADRRIAARFAIGHQQLALWRGRVGTGCAFRQGILANQQAREIGLEFEIGIDVANDQKALFVEQAPQLGDDIIRQRNPRLNPHHLNAELRAEIPCLQPCHFIQAPKSAISLPLPSSESGRRHRLT